MPTFSLDNIHNCTTSGVSFHHRPLNEHMVGRCWVWHDFIALGQRTQSWTKLSMACHRTPWTTYTVRRRPACHAIIILGKHTILNDVGCYRPPFPWEAHTVGLRRVIYSIIALRMTDGRITVTKACYHHPKSAHTEEICRMWHASMTLKLLIRFHDIGGGMTTWPLGSKLSRIASSVTCYHHSCATHTVGQCSVSNEHMAC